MNIRFERIELADIQARLSAHALTLASPIDSFLEDHILQSHHYRIVVDGEMAGWTAVHNEGLLTQFALDAPYRHLGQPIFARVRKLEQVREAFVPTCDEFFLAHALDDFRTLEKQAYFFQAQPNRQRRAAPAGVTQRRADPDDIEQMTTLIGDFFDRAAWRVAEGQLYVALREGAPAGYGVIERSTLYPAAASVGMITVEPLRGQGIGTAIIRALLDECARQQLTPIAGCWCYNHLSKKTLEKAGMYSQTRLLKISY
ncbi:MAG: GNAT family N-acetyltransferase [Caldilineaceae bacterium]|jgi:GNAT superfamily N-acetyltransferase|nr:GNAT family N-acetyltransferase [Caldilineaceae bacterium]